MTDAPNAHQSGNRSSSFPASCDGAQHSEYDATVSQRQTHTTQRDLTNGPSKTSKGIDYIPIMLAKTAMTSRCTGHVAMTDKLTEVVTSEGHEPSITHIPDRTMNGSCDKTVWRWDLQAGKEIEGMIVKQNGHRRHQPPTVDGLSLLVANGMSVIPGSSNAAMKLLKQLKSS
ncbi:hypothetical protein K503DRAFT_393843 [Rhizopogon vinicolor AM-OR11-026]|uniref:WD40 repeat-like protein n=1 Tax=Rhizopogon vinicolor AM-OR11-026 TaxID=1314800 RepID=A0A1B7MRC3_9AGAM|nr:hypothetical protein K503DRAFT_393843 [Rhizopogon vinicolor AM-OR11-026]